MMWGKKSSLSARVSVSRLFNALAAIALFAIASSCAEDEVPTQRSTPASSIVMISLDTTRPDHLSVYGYDRPTSPNLDALARDSLVMQNFVTTSSWTLPTHASLFTGLYPSTHGAHYSDTSDVALGDAEGAPEGFEAFRANRLPDEAVTLAEVLRNNGYETYAVAAGPWFKPVFGLAQGFDHYDAAFDSLAGRTGDEVSELALGLIERAGQRPFFLFLNYFDPHDPYDPHGTSWEQFLKPNDDFARSKELAHYDAEILFMDQQIGRVIDDLKARGHYDSSWIVVTSDHGEHFGEHGLEVHGFSLYEGVVRGVLLIKPPAGVTLEIDPEMRSQSVDVMPTLLDALQIALPSAIEGQPLRSADHPAIAELYRSTGNVRWKGERFRRELRAIYSGSDSGNYKLIISSKDGDPDAGLFDLEADPGENHDLSAERPEVVKDMTRALEHWSANQSALSPVPVEDLDPETRRQMEALGYIDGGATPEP
ncbi:MAG: sulfatase [Deltaproteobacteria bacterium]|nr:sulfatase [Deltaproteobacteria bacterium]